MSETINIIGITKKERYESLIPQVKALVEGETDVIANLSNIIAALKYGMNFFWVGVYFVKEKELVLGPFQGPVACTRIAFGKGVCGKSWETKETIIVEDVDKFPGHIACSSESKSEIVLPIFNNDGMVQMVLDVDSEHIANFDETDKSYLNIVVEIINSFLN
jgi:GAF domain-containing protein